MNILPLVSAFILIFAIGTYTFIHTVSAAIQEKKHYASALFIDRELSCKVQRKLYKNYPGKDLDEREHNESKKDENAKFRSPRDKFIRINESKLNLSPLLEKPDPKLENIARALIQFLYERTSIAKTDVDILKVILETAKKHRNLHTVDELLTKIPKEHFPLFYKLIKGTQTYTLYTNKGYPPLGDFLIFASQPQIKAINFSKASRPLLDALFEKQTASLTINEEKHIWEKDHKHIPLKKDELTAFLLNHGKNLSDYEDLLSFSNNAKGEPQWLIADEETKIQLKVQK